MLGEDGPENDDGGAEPEPNNSTEPSSDPEPPPSDDVPGDGKERINQALASDQRDDIQEIDDWRRRFGYALIATSVVSGVCLLYLIIHTLPTVPNVEKVVESSQEFSTSGLRYSMAVLVAHGIVTGSLLYVLLKLIDIGERLLIPITQAEKVPDATASGGSGGGGQDSGGQSDNSQESSATDTIKQVISPN
jgi:hypothetical protein